VQMIPISEIKNRIACASGFGQAFSRFSTGWMLFTFVIRIAEHPARADNELYQPGSVIRRRRTIYWRTADLSANGPSMRSPGR
jgi:hypothetical protein